MPGGGNCRTLSRIVGRDVGAKGYRNVELATVDVRVTLMPLPQPSPGVPREGVERDHFFCALNVVLFNGGVLAMNARRFSGSLLGATWASSVCASGSTRSLYWGLIRSVRMWTSTRSPGACSALVGATMSCASGRSMVGSGF